MVFEEPAFKVFSFFPVEASHTSRGSYLII